MLCQEITKRTGRALEITGEICDLLQTAGFCNASTARREGTFGDEFDVKGQILIPLRTGLGWGIPEINKMAEMMEMELPVPVERYILSLFRRAIAD